MFNCAVEGEAIQKKHAGEGGRCTKTHAPSPHTRWAARVVVFCKQARGSKLVGGARRRKIVLLGYLEKKICDGRGCCKRLTYVRGWGAKTRRKGKNQVLWRGRILHFVASTGGQSTLLYAHSESTHAHAQTHTPPKKASLRCCCKASASECWRHQNRLSLSRAPRALCVSQRPTTTKKTEGGRWRQNWW
jgi:hypothetical protein